MSEGDRTSWVGPTTSCSRALSNISSGTKSTPQAIAPGLDAVTADVTAANLESELPIRRRIRSTGGRTAIAGEMATDIQLVRTNNQADSISKEEFEANGTPS